MSRHRLTTTVRTTAVTAAVVGMSAWGAAGAAGAAPTAAATEDAVAMVAANIVSFDQIAGQPQWKTRAEQRIRQGVWTFYDSGQFTYSSVNYNPLEGSYTLAGSTVTFSGENTSSSGVGATHTWMTGTIDFSVDPPVMSFEQGAGSAMGAHVGGGDWGSNSTTAYTGTITLAAAS
ncbi:MULTISPECIES: hypothetical protein [Rhodococcus]|uniref:hypothetical protein n=1 Tax=Rhodococcus TaxID=1827 RepID=UPI000C9A1E51|nr:MULTISPECIES: hypothetical protein [Rhodococcus]PND53631.1 hypothetical protein CQZ88_02245 [Rhodococcus sp. ENV425]WKW98908.1 hypothetical protein Q3O43_00775 [Rhodococcus aetherivorans]